MSSISELTQAIYLHTQWRFRLKREIQGGGGSDISIAEAGDPAICSLGRWLQTRAEGNLPHYSEIVRKHADFHQEVRRLLELIAQSDHPEYRQQAGNELDNATSAFSLASARLVNLLSKAQQELEGGAKK
jgi:hypothetical protein